MLVCTVSSRARRSLVVALAEAGAALDDVNGLFGSILSEAASADAVVTVGAFYTTALVESEGAVDAADATITGAPAVIAADVLEAATADTAQDATASAAALFASVLAASRAGLPSTVVADDGSGWTEII